VNGLAFCYRAASGVVLGLALFGITSHAALLLHVPVASIALPCALLAGFALAAVAPARTPLDPRRAPVAATALALATIALITGIVAVGALATPARAWDGTVAWEAKAAFLQRAPTLDQDFFARAAVYCPSRDYPLLQPLALAAGSRLLGDGAGRALFPLLFAVLAALVGTAARLRTRSALLGPIAALALAVTPLLVSPTAGAADSGYADLFLATTMAAAAAALLLDDRPLLAAAACVAVLVKPEGLVYGALPAAVLWYRGARAPLRWALGGWICAAALWLPLQHRLLYAEDAGAAPHGAVWAALLALAACVLGSDALLHRRAASPRVRTMCALGLVPVVLLGGPLLAVALGNEGGSMGLYLADAARPIARLRELPALLLGLFDRALLRMRFLATFALLLALAATFAVRRRRPPAPELSLFLGLGLLTALTPFLLSPEDDLAHLLRSTMPRVLLHWTGVAWIAIAVWWHDALAEKTESAFTA
jgi:hypothetical protein